MSIKKRFLISYILGMVVPVLLLWGLAQFEPEENRGFMPYGSSLIHIEAETLKDPVKQKEMEAYVQTVNGELTKTPALASDPQFIKTVNDGMKKFDPYAFMVFSEQTQSLVSIDSQYVWTEQDKLFNDKAQNSLAEHALIFIACYLLVYNMLAYYMARSITKPLNRLKTATGEIAKLNFSHRIGVHGNDEIGEATKAFDTMAEEAEKALDLMRQYEENRKELMANISHDLKTPLTAIKGSIAAINEGVADTPEKKEMYWQIITSRIQSMQHMIDELLLFSKLDLQKEPFAFQPVLLHRFVEDVIGEWKLAQGDAAVHIGVQYEESIEDRVLLDLEKMNRVLGNILDNAVKYGQVTPLLITVTIARQDNRIVLSIRDNGIGVPRADVPKLFDRFYRGDVSRDSSISGSGLGLSIARQVVNAHEGIITAESDTHQGMCIRIELNISEGGEALETHTDH